MKIEIEKPVIPQFVSEWIGSLYDEGGSKYDAIGIMFEYSSKHDKPVHDWYVNNKSDFITAVMYGYEIQKEPLYQVIFFKDEDRTWTIFLSKEGKFVQTIKQANADYLTEQEIKDIDERFWPFAERVVRREGDANE
ncbi:DUF1642 domain-containing protein [Jeotgalibaca porci]|uniref:DUF1642 domain-containing protein n=1 Tax=Jeotgalibaca porci TaxID=1868793 RepID=UPI00359F726A